MKLERRTEEAGGWSLGVLVVASGVIFHVAAHGAALVGFAGLAAYYAIVFGRFVWLALPLIGLCVYLVAARAKGFASFLHRAGRVCSFMLLCAAVSAVSSLLVAVYLELLRASGIILTWYLNYGAAAGQGNPAVDLGFILCLAAFSVVTYLWYRCYRRIGE